MRLQPRSRRSVLAMGILLAGVSNATAATRTWNSIASTDFNLATNWAANAVPHPDHENSMGAAGTVDSTLTANATVNGLIFTNGRSVILDTSTFQLITDGGAANDIAVTGSGGAHTITGDKGAADLRFSHNSNNQINVAGGSSLQIDATIGGPVGAINTAFRFLKDGAGEVELAADNSATWVSLGNPGASFTPLTVRGGVVTLSSVGAKGASTNNVSVYQGSAAQSDSQGGGTLRLAASPGDFNAFGGTNSTQGFLELSGRGWTGGDFATGEGSLRNTVGDNFITTSNGGSVRIANNGSVAEDGVRIRVDLGTSLTISTPILNGALFNPTVPTLEKTGAGLLAFDSTDKSYTGNTLVMEGTLQMNSNYTGGGNFTVNSGAMLAGTGGIGASGVTVNAGGFLAPGASIESLDVGSATGAGTLLIEYDGEAGADLIDLLNVSGDLNILNMAVDFALLPLGNPLDDAAIIFAKYGSRTGSAFVSEANVPSGYYIDYAYFDGVSDTNIALVTIPEPATFSLVGIALAVSCLSARRRHSR